MASRESTAVSRQVLHDTAEALEQAETPAQRFRAIVAGVESATGQPMSARALRDLARQQRMLADLADEQATALEDAALSRLKSLGIDVPVSVADYLRRAEERPRGRRGPRRG